jgi:ABC-type nitrate/sulfonate/bicarbonate transport system substrate-binding protein
MKEKSICLIAILIMLVIFGCSKHTTGNENGYVKKNITINCGAASTVIVIQTIMVKNLLPHLLPDDVEITWSFLTSSVDQRDSLIAGRIDLMSLSAPIAISAIENGLPVRILGNQVATYAKVFSTKDNIKSMSDLTVNSRITVNNIGATQHFAFALLCKDLYKNGGIFSNGIVPILDEDSLGLIQTSKDYDAYILGFPFLLKIPEEVNYHVVEDLTPTAIKYGAGTYFVTSDDFAKNNPIIVDAFLKACRQAVGLLINNTEEMAESLAEFYGVDPNDVVQLIQQRPPKIELSELGYDAIAELMLEMGMLDSPPKKFSALPNYDDIIKER